MTPVPNEISQPSQLQPGILTWMKFEILTNTVIPGVEIHPWKKVSRELSSKQNSWTYHAFHKLHILSENPRTGTRRYSIVQPCGWTLKLRI